MSKLGRGIYSNSPDTIYAKLTRKGKVFYFGVFPNNAEGLAKARKIIADFINDEAKDGTAKREASRG